MSVIKAADDKRNIFGNIKDMDMFFRVPFLADFGRSKLPLKDSCAENVSHNISK